MDLIERYLQAVRFWLPADHKEDIVAEMAEDLRAEIAEREGAEGRTLTEAEVAELVKRRGHPMEVASRYFPATPLIGSTLLPSYWLTLRFLLVWILLPAHVFVVGPLKMAMGKGWMAAILATAGDLASRSIFTVGILTLVFALLQRYAMRWWQDWDPRKLTVFPSPVGHLEPPKVSTAISDLVSAVVAGMIMLWVLRGSGSLEVAGMRLSAAPIWYVLGMPILAMYAAEAALAVTRLAKPWDQRVQEMWSLGLSVFHLVLIGLLMQSESGILVTPLGAPRELWEKVLYTLTLWWRIGLVVAAVIVLAQATTKAWRLVRLSKAARTPIGIPGLL